MIVTESSGERWESDPDAARLLIGGRTHKAGAQCFQPTVLAHVDASALLCREKTFGPVAGEQDAIALANASRAGLASYLFTSNLDRAARVTEALEFSMVGLNTGLISTEVAPSAAARNPASAAKAPVMAWPNFRSLRPYAPRSARIRIDARATPRRCRPD